MTATPNGGGGGGQRIRVHRGEGLDETLKVLSKRFERPSRTPNPEPEAPTT